MARLIDAKSSSAALAQIWKTAEDSAWRTKREFPDQWGARNRVYGPGTGVPGPRNPDLTPYMRRFSRAFGDPNWKLIVAVTSAQSSKTETFMDVIGERLDNRPAPILYVGPSREFNADQFEPRLNDLFRQSQALLSKMPGGIEGKRQKKTLKRIAGTRVRLAHAGSSTALKSDPAAIALVDEYDEMLKNVRGQGDPLGLVEARGDSYADFQIGVASTPSLGMVEIVRDEQSGLEFWGEGDEENITSPIWRLWQSGTRHHFCWPCPHCGEYFVPRYKQLRWPKNATPAQALKAAWVECPRCEGKITEEHKAECNARGEFVAPGEMIDRDGNVTGSPVETTTLSLWTSGLCTPLKTIGDRADRYLRALATGDSDKIQTAVNAGFGELHLPGGGDIPEWQDIEKRKEEYSERIPPGVAYLVMSVDVQGNRLPYIIRGFGAGGTSWLIEHGYIWGPTKDREVWDKLSEKLTGSIEGRMIKIAFVDSGFRPGKKDKVPLHRVYEFCRKHKRIAFASKGSSTAMARPIISSQIEIESSDGKAKKFGLELQRLDTDHWKSVVHERLSFDLDAPGALHLNADVDEDYCQQIVAEARVRGPSGRHVWVPRYRENHFLDCEAMAAAAAWRLGVDSMKAAKADAKARHFAAQARERLGSVASVPAPSEEEPELSPAQRLAAARAASEAAKRGSKNRFAELAARMNK